MRERNVVHRSAATTVLFVCLAAEASTGFRAEPFAGGYYSGDGGPATAAPLASVQGIAFSPDGDLYFADAADHRLRRIDKKGTITTIAGDGRPGFSGDGGPAQKARVNAPYGVALGADGAVYFCDLGNARVRRIDPSGIVETIAGGGQATPGVEPVLAIEAKLAGPRNVLLHPSGDLLVTDFYAHRVYRISPTGWLATATDGELKNPGGLTRDGAGAVFIADSGSRRVLRLWGGVLTPLAGLSGALAFKLPTGVAIDRDGRYHVADGNDPAWFPAGSPVRAHAAQEVAAAPDGTIYLARGGFLFRLDRDGILRHVAGSGDWGVRGDGGPRLEAHLQAPAALAATAGGAVYIADAQTSRLRLAGVDGTLSAIGAGPTESWLSAPAGLAVHPLTGDLYIADTGNNRIQILQADRGRRTLIASAGPGKLAFDESGGLYVTEAGAGRVLQQLPLGHWRVVAGGLDRPRAVAVAANGAVYIGEAGANRVQRIARDGARQSIPARAPLALALLGDRLFIAEEGYPGLLEIAPGSAPRRHLADVLEAPLDVIAMSDGTLLAADAVSRRVWRLTPEVLPPPQVTRLRVLHAATGEEGPFAPGQLVALPDAPPGEFRVNGQPQPASVLPGTLPPGSTARIDVAVGGEVVAEAAVEIVEAAPGLFQEGGILQATNEDGTPNGPDQP
ncbi:MAG TPA: hypothetical protein DEH78_05740, partial [Solibacterales bacterium]|nr:hypothetical protein [Bryobacterales bacterium]